MRHLRSDQRIAPGYAPVDTTESRGRAVSWDKGPWKAETWERKTGRVYVVQSDDFTHDVALEISGDFLPEDRMKYAEWLAQLLTAACNPASGV